MTDENLRKLLKSSPDKAHRLIFDEYYNYVYTIVFNRLRSFASREDIDECVSDVFSDIFLKYDPNREYSGDVKGYVATISKRRSIDMFRRLNARKADTVSIDGDDALQLASSERVDEITERTETAHEVLDAVNSLGEPDSTIIMQKYYYGKSSYEIADMVGMKADAVRKRLSRVLKRLRDVLSDIGEGKVS
ncbi:RNA polymerase sigma factor [Ruminococcus flavefaciens]|uniref:RNA polymerase sigma factor n=1 Tax=Ruminococcus flavefaciens TaxID=1265 RepID=UPI00048D64AE|nr:sigma-70 family RNA polymerase sigma factor [Ruminococcus flavefaciens]